MTSKLAEAIKRLEGLSSEDQDKIAEVIETELAERRWDELFARPELKWLLLKMADEARREYRVCKTVLASPNT